MSTSYSATLMQRVLRLTVQRSRELGRDESGVVMIISLLTLLFLYVTCLSVYAVGSAIGTKMRLQNVADAAAYSAAVLEADALSRIATLNRALSWTYIAMTRKQMDTIVYRWMKLMVQRIDEDKETCRKHNCSNIRAFGTAMSESENYKGTVISNSCSMHHHSGNQDTRDTLGTWWLGWSATSPDTVRLGFRNSQIVSVDELNRQIQKFDVRAAEHDIDIDIDKSLIKSLNNSVKLECLNLPVTLQNGVISVLRNSIPQEEYGDYRFIHQLPSYAYPYAENSQDSVFSAYRNTEEDELEFLSMSMDLGKVPNDMLHQVFGDGIDQWFVRGSADCLRSTAMDIRPDLSNYTGKGIQRGYRSHNRNDSRGDDILRGNHVSNRGRYNAGSIRPYFNNMLRGMNSLDPPRAIEIQTIERQLVNRNATTSLGGNYVSSVNENQRRNSILPSAFNSSSVNLEQCGQIADRCGLVGEYNWASMRWMCFSVHYERLVVTFWGAEWVDAGTLNYHFKMRPLLAAGNHAYATVGEGYTSHTRDRYRPCVSGMDDGTNPHGSTNRVPGYLLQGHARIYGDDKDIYDEDLYLGEMAKPIKLNERFFQHGNVVAVARRRKNLLHWLVSGGNTILPDKSLYAIFNPAVKGSWSFAISAARAGYREAPDETVYGRRRLQTKYAVVSSGQISDTEQPIQLSTNARLPFDLKNGGAVVCKANSRLDGRYHRSPYRLGCPHGRDANRMAERLQKTWNLCETDWDAAFVPIRYLGGGFTAAFDGLNEQVNINTKFSVANTYSSQDSPLMKIWQSSNWKFLTDDGLTEGHETLNTHLWTSQYGIERSAPDAQENAQIMKAMESHLLH